MNARLLAFERLEIACGELPQRALLLGQVIAGSALGRRLA
jgi:hypothetical protein